MKRPYDKLTVTMDNDSPVRTPSETEKSSCFHTQAKTTISLELADRSSRSLLANVLDLDDDFRFGSEHCIQHPTAGYTYSNTKVPNCRSASWQMSVNHRQTDEHFSSENHPGNTEPRAGSRVRAAKFGRVSAPGIPAIPKSDMNTDLDIVASSTATLLEALLKELQFVTHKLQADDKRAELCSEWKFAAMVIDRLCLWLFVIFTVTSTFGILFSAPNMFK